MSSARDTSMANAFIPGNSPLPQTMQALVERRERVLGTAYRLMYQEPIHVSRGEGVWLFSPEGEKYLDAYNNVSSLGHSHPAVAQAIARQASVLATHTRYLQDEILDYSERLLATFPPAIDNVMFTCSGSEANDLAYRIAKYQTGGTGVIVTETAYHGITDAVSQFSPSLGPNVPLGAHVFKVPAPDNYRLGAEAAAIFLNGVDVALDAMAARGIKPAALIVDSIFTSDGIFAEPGNFLAAAAQKIRAAGGLYIADEVQSGFGRTGTHMWGFERHNVLPDLVTMGKPMGNGFPVAGIAAQSQIIREFGLNARYFNTFGGNAVACAAAMAVLETIQSERLMDNARQMGDALRLRLAALSARYPQIGDVRGAGLMIGVEIVAADRAPDKTETTRLVNGMRKRGVLISSCGAGHNVLKIRPPLIFQPEHVDIFVAAFEAILSRPETAGPL